MKNLITCLTVTLVSGATFATTWTVDDDGKADFDNIQAAVDAASDGDEIVVMPGTYTSSQDGHVVNMLGKEVWLHSSKGAEATIINGEYARRGIACFNNETSKTIISGFTITNGYGVGFDYNGNGEIDYYEDAGGGMLNFTSSSPTLTNCTFENNTAEYGGGMYITGGSSNTTLTNCIFTSNTANTGGGMFNYGSSPTLTNCTFTGNNGNYGGGGMYNYFNTLTLIDCTFDGNTANWNGGGMANYFNTLTLIDCTFDGNTANGNGGGMANDECNLWLTNCTFTNNIVSMGGSSAALGGGMWTTGGDLWLSNCKFISNSATGTGLGGGMWNSGSSLSLTLTDCTLAGNTATYGGGMHNSSNPPTLTDTTVCDNTLDQIYGDWIDGGGVCVAYSCEDNNGDGIPDKCTNPGGNTILVPEEYATIQDAINVAVHGDEIIIGPGTYTGVGGWVVNPMGKRLWIHSSDGPEVTIIDGEGVRRGIQCAGGETSETIFEGLTITNGNQGGEWYEDGGAGMHNFQSSPTLTECTFMNNEAYYGGGMFNFNSSPTLTNCTFTGNTAVYSAAGGGDGGGMYNRNSSPALTDCTFEGNSASTSGGGMYNFLVSFPSLTNCSFTGNSSYRGGGMRNQGGNPTLINCAFTDNTAAVNGGGMFNGGSSPTLTDTVVCGNTPDQIYGDWTDYGGNTIADECPLDCPDINGDGNVDVSDLLAIIDQWGLTNSPADVNSDGIVDVSDLLIVVGNWGPCE